VKAIQLISLRQPLAERSVAEPELRDGEIMIEIRAAGICHSDAHYRSGFSQLGRLPQTLGHEIAGVVVGRGDRVAVHYLLPSGAMIGKDVDGGYAERIAVPEANVVPIPPNVSFEVAAVMMCSTSTAYHALRLAGLRAGEKVAVVGLGGVGVSAMLLARMMGATVIGVDRIAGKRRLADTAAADIRDVRGVDVVIDLVGHPDVRSEAIRALAPGGRLMLVALNDQPFTFDPYREVLARELRIIGSSDHLLSELHELMTFASEGRLDLSPVITRRVPLDAAAVNGVLDDLERGTAELRTVIS
jgi:2-desacetyl-2-hydroxyethyl bacteriochlorophyllide A dehydrogenase